MEISPVTLEGEHVRLEPLLTAHEELLIAAASDGELWNSTVTIVPSSPANMIDYIQAALNGQAQGRELPFVIIRKSGKGVPPVKASGEVAESGALASASARAPGTRTMDDKGEVVGTTRFYDIKPNDRGVAIGYTWLSKSAQRTVVNTESKLLLLTHAFEHWQCIRVELLTDVLNEQSRTAILRLGAKEEGILRSHMIMPGGRIRDSVIFSIVTEEWPEVRARLAGKL